MSKRKNSAEERIFRSVIVANVRNLVLEKMYLQKLHSNLQDQVNSLNKRIDAIGRRIEEERAQIK